MEAARHGNPLPGSRRSSRHAVNPSADQIARAIAVNRSPSSHLAGAAGLHLEPTSIRVSNDLDYFHDREVLVSTAFAADRALLEKAGYTVEIMLSQPGFVRAIVARASRGDKGRVGPRLGVALPAADCGPGRWLSPPSHRSFHQQGAGIGGTRRAAGFPGRAFRSRTYLSFGSLCWAAVGKDPGYGPEMLVEMLARKGRYRAEDFASLELLEKPNLAELKLSWIAALEGARRLVKHPPAGGFRLPVLESG